MSGDAGAGRSRSRTRLGWWLFVTGLGILAAYIAYSFVGLLVLGAFGYYATRPICQRLDELLDSDGLAAGITVLLVLLPIIVVGFYTGLQVVQRANQVLSGTQRLPVFVKRHFELGALPTQQRRALLRVVREPRQLLTSTQVPAKSLLKTGVTALSALFSTLLFVALSITLSFFLLKNDEPIAGALRDLFGGRETAAYAYAAAVDEDLESVFFGNLQFVIVMTVVAAVAYSATNLLAPAGIGVPMVFALAFLTGVASLIPVVVGKVVYVPVAGYLALQSFSVDGTHSVFVGAALVSYFVLLDILPQTFLQPYLSGRHLDAILLLFGYLLGPVLFGWYGFFLLPIIFIVTLEAIRIVLPELLHGERLTPTVSLGESVGASLPTTHEASDTPDDSAARTTSDDAPPERTD